VLRSVFIALCLISLAAHADEGEVRAPFGTHPGYLFNVIDEKSRRDIEMVMLERQKPPPRPIKEIIFNERLSKEFQTQYQYRFGQTTAEQVRNSPGRNGDYTYYNNQNVTVLEYQKYQRQFGEYMGRRLVEYHFDDWAKSDPAIRPIYELKDRVSNIDVKINKSYKLKWKYSFAGPYMEATLENPFDIEAKVQAQMTGVISAPSETIYSCGYPVTNRVRVSGQYRYYDGVYQAVVARRMTKSVSMSLSGSVDARKEGPAIQQNLFLVGLSWAD